MPTSLVKLAPEFCSVYVISKGKMVVGQTAKRPVVNTATPPKQPSPHGLPPCIPTEQTEADNGARYKELMELFICLAFIIYLVLFRLETHITLCVFYDIAW